MVVVVGHTVLIGANTVLLESFLDITPPACCEQCIVAGVCPGESTFTMTSHMRDIGWTSSKWVGA